MENSTVGIYMYVKGDVTRAMVSLVATGGVVRAGINARIKQLLDIEYDPRFTSSREIINAVRQRGSIAALVGM